MNVEITIAKIPNLISDFFNSNEVSLKSSVYADEAMR